MRKRCERERALLKMFNEAAEELTEEDLQERESLVAGFAGRTTPTHGPEDPCYQGKAP